jgi:hypothetical protein
MNRKRNFLTVTAILVAFVVGAAVNSIFHIQVAQAHPVRTIPKSYGTLKGASGVSLIFEDSAGTIRLVTAQEEFNTLGVSVIPRN